MKAGVAAMFYAAYAIGEAGFGPAGPVTLEAAEAEHALQSDEFSLCLLCLSSLKFFRGWSAIPAKPN